MINVMHGDCRDVLKTLGADSIEACFTDPPYGLEFMNKTWDGPKGWERGGNFSQPGIGERQTEWPSFSATGRFGAANPTCGACGGRARGAKKCTCETPAWKPIGKRRDPENEHLPSDMTGAGMLGHMRLYQSWSTEWARELYRVLKPGAYLMACGGTRTYHRLVCAIEDAGFEVRDCCSWLYGQGFPKSRDASKAIDQAAGAEREVVGRRKTAAGISMQGDTPGSTFADDNYAWANEVAVTAPATPEAAAWSGFGTALKPAQELIVLARKPMTGNLAQNLLKHGTGAINVDGCRVSYENDAPSPATNPLYRLQNGYKHAGSDDAGSSSFSVKGRGEPSIASQQGRWPANLCHDGSEEVLDAFAAYGERKSGHLDPWHDAKPSANGSMSGGNYAGRVKHSFGGDTGSAARFFFSPKADAEARIYECTICQRKINAADRARHKHGQKNSAHIKSHPTVKPIDLIRYYLRLIVPPGGTVLDPFAGTGTTGEASMLEGFDCLMIERDAGSVADIQHRIHRWSGLDAPLFAEAAE